MYFEHLAHVKIQDQASFSLILHGGFLDKLCYVTERNWGWTSRRVCSATQNLILTQQFAPCEHCILVYKISR